MIPLHIPNESIKQVNIKSPIVNISFITPVQKEKKKKVIKKVLKKSKVKVKPKPKPKPKPKLISKPKPLPVIKKREAKPQAVKKSEPIEKEIEKEIEEVQEEKVEVKTEDDLEQKRKFALAQQAKRTYYDTIYEVISENKRYPKRARRYKKEGSVRVSFKVLQDGSIVNLELIKLSKHKSLNKAVRKLFEKLRSFPSPPSNLSFPLELSITINYKLRR